MDRRIETRVIDTDGEEKSTLIQKDACEVWWITISHEAAGVQGLLQIYDGFDASGKLEWQIEPGYARQHNFIPPIPCDQGIFVYNNGGIASYTIAFRPKSWPREMP